jgi:hypothetical protein
MVRNTCPLYSWGKGDFPCTRRELGWIWELRRSWQSRESFPFLSLIRPRYLVTWLSVQHLSFFLSFFPSFFLSFCFPYRNLFYLLILGVVCCCTWSNSATHTHSVWLLWTRDRPIAETCTWQHTPFKIDKQSNQDNRQSSEKNNNYQLLYTYGFTSWWWA